MKTILQRRLLKDDSSNLIKQSVYRSINRLFMSTTTTRPQLRFTGRLYHPTGGFAAQRRNNAVDTVALGFHNLMITEMAPVDGRRSTYQQFTNHPSPRFGIRRI